jgi:secretion/DNA translocation related TadE-like protein
MPGTALAVGVLAVATALAGSLCAVGGASVASQRATGAADAGALAAADAASGAASGVPCDRAAEVAATFGAVVIACDVTGVEATVAVSVPFGPLSAGARARAGPPP